MCEESPSNMKNWLQVRKQKNTRKSHRPVKSWQRNVERSKTIGPVNIKHLVCTKLCDRYTIPDTMDTTMILSKKLHKDNIKRRLLDIISRNPTKKVEILAYAIKYVIAFNTNIPYNIQVLSKTRDVFISTIANISGSDYPEILQFKIGVGKFSGAFTAAYYLSINSLLSFVQALKGIVDYTNPATVNGRGETLYVAAYEGMKVYKIGKINRMLVKSDQSITNEELIRLISPDNFDVFEKDLMDTIVNIPFKLKAQWATQIPQKSCLSFADRSKFRRIAKKTQPIIRGWLIRKKN
tara:strand:+ start:690 stop:1571 length:882 start_codon:yes stop_codon:yes gene_type:complete